MSRSFNFFFTKVKSLDAKAFRDVVEDTEKHVGDRPTTYVLSNHDLTRALTRFGDGKDGGSNGGNNGGANGGKNNDDLIAKLLASMLLTLRGSPFIYYGEEIGMTNHDPQRIEDVRDPVGRTYWPGDKGRDGERTPMQWNGEKNAGFTGTGAKPWLPVPASAAQVNAVAEGPLHTSILSFYRRLIRLRRASPALLDGEYKSLGDSPDVFAFRRSTPKQTMFVALNMSAKEQTISLAGQIPNGKGADIVISNIDPVAKIVAGTTVHLRPYEAVVLELVERW